VLGGPGVGRPQWELDGKAIDQAGFCVIHLFEALVAINHMTASSPLTPQLEQLNRQIHLIVVRQRCQQGLPIPGGFDPEETTTQ
jgi:hypothetical protein